MVRTYGEIYADVRHRLISIEGVDEASHTAWLLMEAAAGQSTAYLLAHRRLYASEEIEQKAMQYAERYAEGEPIAYILGAWGFADLQLKVTPDVLIPRDDTMVVTSLAIRKTKLLPTPQPRVLDLCCGSGCIGLAIANSVKDAHLTLGDVSQPAIRVAKQNASATGLSARVRCLPIDARKPAAAFLGKFDVIVSNPPYITEEEMKTLDPSVQNYEPHLALCGGQDGLDFYRAIVQNYTCALKPGGYLCFEFGMGQCDAVCDILRTAGYEMIEIQKDTGDRDRAVCARKSREES